MSRKDRSRAARRLGRRTIRGPQTVEAYLRASSPPRYMQRLREMEVEFDAQRRRLAAAYCALREACGDRAEAFSRRWRAHAHAWRFDRLNELIREHNAWYPVEADLPMNPRTRDYVAVSGASYRRIELGPEWILEHFPPAPHAQSPPAVPRELPREPAARRQASPSTGPRRRFTARTAAPLLSRIRVGQL